MKIYDLIIIGGGPAGVSAAIYAARKKLKTAIIAEKFSGQSDVSQNIQNWIGTPSISGVDLAKNMKNHLNTYAGDVVDINETEKIEGVKEIEEEIFEIKTNKETYKTKTILVATGSHRRRLEAKNADNLEHKGITYCASCDGPFFVDKDVVVVGAGNSGFETASQLLAYTKSVTILNRNGKIRADEVTVKKVSSHPNFKLILNTKVTEVLGENYVTGLIYKDAKNGELTELKTDGIFVEIGSIPTTSFLTDLVDLNDYNAIKVDSITQKTSKTGIWAAGDVTDGLYHQNNIAAGDAIKALENIYLYLNTK